MAVQLAHARGVAHHGALADAAEADDRAHRPPVTGDLGVGGHAGTLAEHHCPITGPGHAVMGGGGEKEEGNEERKNGGRNSFTLMGYVNTFKVLHLSTASLK